MYLIRNPQKLEKLVVEARVKGPDLPQNIDNYLEIFKSSEKNNEVYQFSEYSTVLFRRVKEKENYQSVLVFKIKTASERTKKVSESELSKRVLEILGLLERKFKVAKTRMKKEVDKEVGQLYCYLIVFCDP